MKIKPFLKYLIITVISLGILIMGLALAFRERIMNEVIAKVIASEKIKHQLIIEIKEAKFEGLATVKLSGISIVPMDRDTLLRVDQFKVSIAIMPLFLGNIKVSKLQSSDALLNIIHKDGKRNFDFLLKKNTEETKDSLDAPSTFDLAEFANNIINELLYKVPDEMLIEHYRLNIVDEEHAFHIDAKSIAIDKHELNSTFVLNDTSSTWHAVGNVYPSDRKLNIQFYSEKGPVELPYLKDKFGLTLQFDTIATEMNDIEYRSNELQIFGKWSISNLLVNHPKISIKDVMVARASIDCNMFIGEQSISIDSSSVAYLGDIVAKPYIKYTLGKNKIYELKLNTLSMDAQSFFNSFPKGLFNSIEGIKVEGQLAYHLNFYLDAASPWKCKFNSELEKNNFKVLGYGEVNLAKMNSSFVYTPFEFGKSTRSFVVGPDNPNYTPYDQISDYIKNALLTSEDPLFFSHRGFYMEAFRQSIATNFVTKKFKRGGSTISMQLVKNVFLSRNKTIARKLEEMIIVWLIENNRLTSKQRMFEVYLNIIEWAPNVYGIGEASRFYFNKPPSKLNLGESIFLASIVPKPKKFKYSFLPSGALKPYMHNYFKFIGGLMVKRKFVSDFDTTNMYNSVVLRGAAKNFVLPDSLIQVEEVDVEMEDLRSLLEENTGEVEK